MPIKDSILTYLRRELELHEQEETRRAGLTRDEKEAEGILLKAHFVETSVDGRQAFFSCNDNNSKLRAGDKVTIIPLAGGCQQEGMVVESGLQEVTLAIKNAVNLESGAEYDLESQGICLVNTIIKVLEQIEEGGAGYPFLTRCSDDEAERKEYPVNNGDVSDNSKGGEVSPNEMAFSITTSHNPPSFFCVQGPPGTGKTTLLARVANALASQGKKVLVVANTHQAVNNALVAVKNTVPDLFVTKVGHWLKRDNLQGRGIRHHKNLWELAAELNGINQGRRRQRQEAHPIVAGMTFISAVIQLGLQHPRFAPNVVLVDEASQIPLTYAVVLGKLQAPNIVFFGDEMQMPPVFPEALKNDTLSVSIFEHLKRLYPDLCLALNRTHRMNGEICELIQRSFYPTIDLQPACDAIREACLSTELNHPSRHVNPDILRIFNDDKSIQLIISHGDNAEDSNQQEAELARDIVLEAMEIFRISSYTEKTDRIAVVAPFRRQVALIRSLLRYANMAPQNMPMVDTVERIQGQTVDMIVLSFCSSDPRYINQNKDFLFDVNRTNVMISRARTKVVILASEKLIGYDGHLPVCALLQSIRNQMVH